eukprot:TRINITY_DN89353_c0_g1_i1.p1 TRINITY_DN89353_c0_g1~~TRINITY_DN89353_c0_g1_i1.p1  ORF type:complete len:157 (+),score=13.91 TRINITY_DN89353_c0_g1_i1:151-621(+)
MAGYLPTTHAMDGALRQIPDAWRPGHYRATIVGRKEVDSHVEYQIGVKVPDGEEWLISRRYREFEHLQSELCAKYGAAAPQLPERRMHGLGKLFLGQPTEEFLNGRQRALQAFLESALIRDRTESGLGEPLRKFLSCTASTGVPNQPRGWSNQSQG